MIHIAETMGIHTAEGFLIPQEITQLGTIMDKAVAEHGRDAHDTRRTSTIHEVPGLAPEEARQLYEPHGRLEMTDIPATAQAILDAALKRRHPQLARGLPSVNGHRPWIFLEYQAGQHITPHADGIAPDPNNWPRQIAAASVTIEQAPDGSGAFYVETSGSDAPWTPAPHKAPAGYAPNMAFIHEGTDASSPWFSTMKRSRWTLQADTGTLILFGSQLIHGTDPVTVGRVRKFLTLLTAENPADRRSR